MPFNNFVDPDYRGDAYVLLIHLHKLMDILSMSFRGI